jgi:thioredoxin-like negative regulator of GroEL
MSVTNATDATFDELFRTGVLLVLFNAPAVGVPANYRRGIESMASARKLPLLHVNIQPCPQTARRFKMVGVPTLWLVRQGDVAAQFLGWAGSGREVSFVKIEEWLDRHLDALHSEE